MNASPSAAVGSSDRASIPAASRLVVDAPTRMFHWLFALSFVGAYVTAESEHWRLLHVSLGYAFAGLLVFRVLYGLFGPRQAGLGLLWRRLAGVPAWLRSLRSLVVARSFSAVNWRQGQNLTMALAVVAMLALVVPLVLSGYGTYNDWGDVLGGDWLEEVHEFVGNAFLTLVLMHLALIAVLSLLRRQNQALPMLTGRVRGNGPNLVRHNRAWLAGLLLLAVAAFGAWQWRDSPRGLIPLGKGGGSSVDIRPHGSEAAVRNHRGNRPEATMNLMAAWLPPLRAAFAPGSRYAIEALEPAHARRAASPLKCGEATPLQHLGS
ncbi:MAG: cytochrome b/b6 domain-containing protein [Rhizobacter sp.]|nr:cytochrome b/b6 domain-containing protein [Rhizobacter sp.]